MSSYFIDETSESKTNNHLPLKRTNIRGFTLVELLVVIAIVAILGIAAIAALNPAAKINSARDSQAYANIQIVSKAFENCKLDRTVAGSSTGVATDECCGATVAGNCLSSNAVVAGCAAPPCGLAKFGYGFSNGFPSNVAVTRGPAGGGALCISQARASDTNYDKYLIGGSKIDTAAAAACSATTGT